METCQGAVQCPVAVTVLDVPLTSRLHPHTHSSALMVKWLRHFQTKAAALHGTIFWLLAVREDADLDHLQQLILLCVSVSVQYRGAHWATDSWILDQCNTNGEWTLTLCLCVPVDRTDLHLHAGPLHLTSLAFTFNSFCSCLHFPRWF